MPGISLMIGADLATRRGKARLAFLQDAMKHDASYKSTIVSASDDAFLGFTGYPDYPVCVFKSDGCQIVMEGHVYNRDRRQIETGLCNLARRVAGGEELDSEIRRWVLDADGDYVVAMLHPERKQLYIFNDPAGRLPLYFYRDDERFLLSREVKFLAGLMPSVRYDRQGIAETLFFGFTLGARTLVKGASRLDAGSLLHVDLATLKTRCSHTYSLNLDECRHAGKPIKEMVGELKELFVGACGRLNATFAGQPQIVSLSGGLDSRAVAAGMLAADAGVSAATFQNAGSSNNGAEATNAEKVAAAMGIDWERFDVETGRAEDIRQLLALKDGLNYAGMAFILSFFKQLRTRHGPNLVYYTGIGGDTTMKDISPPCRIGTRDKLVGVLMSRHARLDIGQVEALTSVDRRDFRAVVEERIRQYPERNMNRRYVHFSVAERLGRSNWEGEDRNRGFFWSATPFSSFEFFDYAMNVPNRPKRLLRLYEHFMAALCPQCMQINNASWNAPFGSTRRYVYLILHAAYAKLPFRFKHAIRNKMLYEKLQVDSVMKACFDEYADNCPTVLEYLSEEPIRRLLTKGCSSYCFGNLLTIAGYVRIQEDMLSEMQHHCRDYAQQ